MSDLTWISESLQRLIKQLGYRPHVGHNPSDAFNLMTALDDYANRIKSLEKEIAKLKKASK
jgi:hypothetical protein